MQRAETTIVANVVVNLIGVKLMRLIDADEFQKQIAGMAILNNYCGECGCKFDWSEIDETD